MISQELVAEVRRGFALDLHGVHSEAHWARVQANGQRLAERTGEGGSDRHILVLERDNYILYELVNAWPQPDGSWEAGSGAVFDLRSNDLRPAGWTSADAAGLPILPGLVRYDEMVSGRIRHALRFTTPQTRHEYTWPAPPGIIPHRARIPAEGPTIPPASQFRLGRARRALG